MKDYAVIRCLGLEQSFTKNHPYDRMAHVRTHRSTLALAGYAAILLAFRLGLEQSSIGRELGGHFRYAFAGFALLLAPMWFFGFGAGEWIRERIRSRLLVMVLPAMLGFPYVIFALHAGNLHWPLAAAMFLLPTALAALLEFSRPPAKLSWQDCLALSVLVAAYMLHIFAGAWPFAGLAALPKLYVADIALYLYVVVRRLEGMGYSLVPRLSAILIGLREWLFFTPIGVGLGLALGFIHLHREMPSGTHAAAAVFVTFLLIAVPEELFFRGILQNLLETRLRPCIALVIASALFGLSHFPKGAAFNWRYVLLATIAGVFYGRAWHARRQLLASIVTHTAVDVVWSLWFR